MSQLSSATRRVAVVTAAFAVGSAALLGGGVAAAQALTSTTPSVPIPGGLAPSITLLSPSGGPAAGGNEVVITGGFHTGTITSVTFGSKPATIVSQDQTTTTVLAPANDPGDTVGHTVDVTQTGAAGTSANTAADDYTYDGTMPIPGPLKPSITSLTPSHGYEGAQVVIRGGVHTGTITSVKFGLVPASIVAQDPTTTTVVVPAGVTGSAVHVTQTSSIGSSAPSDADTFTYDARICPAVVIVIPPTDLSLVTVGRNTATLSWTAPGTEPCAFLPRQYAVYNGDDVIATTTGTQTTVDLTGLTANTAYSLTVRGVYSGVTSEPTAPVTFKTLLGGCVIPPPTPPVPTTPLPTTPVIAYSAAPAAAAAADPTLPTPPANLSTSDLTDHSVTLRWAPSPDYGCIPITSYEVFNNGVSVAVTSGTSVSLSLVPVTQYSLTVRARAASGATSPDSNPIHVHEPRPRRPAAHHAGRADDRELRHHRFGDAQDAREGHDADLR